ncbi:MAG: exodeoxyribonuclease VII large subunit [Hahellaceae bacterium]|nr:exodeoxyribonuclease VII large subunit [Hahellaceae bacterium]
MQLTENTTNVAPAGTSDHAFSVSELNRQAKKLLEVSFMQVLVQGEISGFTRPASGHWYFTLKDDKAQIRCAMFKGFNQKLRFVPANGDLMMVRARVTLFESRGEYQLNIEHIEPFGLGALQKAFDQLKSRLAQEGLFETRRKRPIPAWPKRIGVVTSPTGAAIHDILSVIERRFPAMQVTLYPTLVQGDAAAQAICKAIALANQHSTCDVLVVGRGGGSLEDLWPFNEEAVARAIAASRLPIVSAVGHEVDFSIADFVADLRAPTPSAAAELLTPDQFELQQRLDLFEHRLTAGITARLERCSRETRNLSQRLTSPLQRLELQARQLAQLQRRLHLTLQHQLDAKWQRYKSANQSLRLSSPSQKLQMTTRQLTSLATRLNQSIRQNIHYKSTRLSEKARHLQALSPLATLERGYAIAFCDQHVVTSKNRVEEGKDLTLQFGDGRTTFKIGPLQK